MDINDIQRGLDVLYGRGRNIPVEAAKETIRRMVPNISGYQQMLRDTAPKARPTTEKIAKDLATKITGVSPDKKTIISKQGAIPKTNVVKTTTEVAKKAPGGWKSWTPFVGDLALAGTALHNVKHGHPWVGGAQGLLAGGGLLLDTATLAELLATPLTAGASTAGAVATQAGKQGIKKAALRYLEKAIAEGAAKNTGKAATKRFIGGEALNLFRNNGGDPTEIAPKQEEFFDNKQQVSQPKQQSQSYGYANSPSYPSGPMGVEEFTRMYGGQYNNDTDYQLPPIQDIPQQNVDGLGLQSSIVQPTVQQGGRGDLDLSQILDLYREMNSANEPYINRVQEYAKRYPQLQGDAFNRDRYLAAMSGLSDNNAYQRMIGRYNPAEIEAQQIDLEGKATEQKQKQLQDLMELLGNATIANELGLPTTAAMANKNLLNTYTGLGKAQIGLQGNMYKADRSAQAKMYVADRISKAKEYDTYVDNQIKMAIAQGNWQNARQLQQMKNDNRIQTSIITGIPFAELGQLFEGTNALGVTNINTSGLNTGGANNSQFF